MTDKTTTVVNFEDFTNNEIRVDSSGDDEEYTKTQVKGKRKSGRGWKEPKKRASSLVKTRGIRIQRNVEKRRALNLQIKTNQQLSKVIKDELIQAKAEKKARREENLRRKEENRKKNEIVQVITKASTIKKMKKKAMRNIEKR